MNSQNLIIFGASGHGKVVAEIAVKMEKYSKIYFMDDYSTLEKFHGFDLIKKSELNDDLKYNSDFFVAIGNNEIRKNKIKELMALDCRLATIIDSTAIVSDSATLNEGSVAMPGAIINSDVKIGKGVIVNTGASVDHDSIIGDFSHISPQAVVAGTVYLGNSVWIGANATVINNVRTVDDVVIGAGSVVTTSITLPGTYVGVPISMIKEKK
ncbi:acetyltransferase [Aerococcus viridans]